MAIAITGIPKLSKSIIPAKVPIIPAICETIKISLKIYAKDSRRYLLLWQNSALVCSYCIIL